MSAATRSPNGSQRQPPATRSAIDEQEHQCGTHRECSAGERGMRQQVAAPEPLGRRCVFVRQRRPDTAELAVSKITEWLLAGKDDIYSCQLVELSVVEAVQRASHRIEA